ncbi:MAG: hypothetical protein AMJ65_14215 [Phycisphaerae bacterium SG8_4]|nr:MAG: hypothetical protein AMJ65_14215 [Phycisphaerae bacterium SG8_4]
MSKRFILIMLLVPAVVITSARADKLTGLSDVTVVDGEIISFRHEGIEYVVADEDVALGTTTRWYIDGGVETLWPEGDPVPAAAPTVPNPSSNAKIGDVGSNADNFFFAVPGDAENISSIDGINFQETVFPFLTNTVFVFERNGNDNGTVQAIRADGSLGTAMRLAAGGAPYASTGVDVNGQTAYGYVVMTDVLVQGVRITAEGHDTLSISAVPVPPDVAHRPSPQDGAMIEQTWVTLGWSPGKSAVSHDVYLGENFDDVGAGIGDTFQGNMTETTLIAGFPGFPIPDGLVPGRTYYWRVDEINDANAASPWRGDVWSFSVQPYTAYNPDPADGTEFVDLDATLSWQPGYGAALHTVYVGTSFDDVNDAVGGSPSGTAIHSPGSLEPEKVYYWRVDEFSPPTTHKGDIWTFTTPGAVGNPQPANAAVDVPMIATLSWTPADNAASSDLYFGTDADAVKNATTASPEYVGNKALGSESHDPGRLAFDAEYYWRVDAVYAAETVKGLLWSFSTADFIAVDDFESYNDIDPPDPASNRIFDKWIDGFGTTTNGALVGNDLPPYAEQTIVHGGAQSMPYSYDNNMKTSEATLTLVYPRDWTAEGVTKLSLWFRGDSGNAAERMFVALNGNVVVYNDNPAGTQTTKWNEWVIDLQAFAGVDLTNVNTITIGFGTKSSPAAGGTGTMYFDDIRLIR